MDKEINREEIEQILEKVGGEDTAETTPDVDVTEDGGSSDAEETELPTVEEKEEIIDPPTTKWKSYVPRFTEASERYRIKGDARIRERLGIKMPELEGGEENPDEIKLDATADFDEDFVSVDAKTPENNADEESDESLNVYKFSSDGENDLDEEAEKEREEIKKLLKSDAPLKEEKAAPAEEDPDLTEVEEAEDVESDADDEYTMPDPIDEDFGVFDFDDGAKHVEDEDVPEGVGETPVATANGKAKKRDREFNNSNQRDSIKDRFLDSLISIRIRTGASLIFALAIFVIELLSATKTITFKFFETSGSYSVLGVVDFLLAACIFVMAIPELFKAVKRLFGKRLSTDLLPIPAFIVFGLYTLTVFLTGATYYALFGLLFATITIPVLTASLYRTKADFIAFKMISQPEDKYIIDKKNTRDRKNENIALDGVIDEYKSKIARTFRTSFVSDFFKNTDNESVDIKHIGKIYGLPIGAAVLAGVAAYFLSWDLVTAVAVVTISVMLGCPAFAIISNKVSYFHSQRAAILSDSVAIGQEAYDSFSSVDVFAFDDTDIFGPDDVNLKRFMLYGERDNMEKVMRQMCALFASVGGPLDCMFSGAIDNRVRHKSATNVIIEDDGVCGEVAGHVICAGSEEYMRRNGIAIPAAATVPENGVSLDTIKIMYASEDGEVYAKFYIRYSFSEEFTMMLSSLRESGITPLIYTRDPNVSNELLTTLTAGVGDMRVLKLYSPIKEETVYGRINATMVTYGDKLDAAEMIILSKKYSDFAKHVEYAELCAALIGVLLAIVLSIVGFGRATVIVASVWQILMCVALRFISKRVFLKYAKKKDEE